MKKVLITIIIIILVIIGGIIILINNANNEKNKQDTEGGSIRVIAPEDSGIKEVDTGKINNLITITSSGFSPNRLEISAGESVTFINQDSSKHWPASNVHPTHTAYPGSDIKKCQTNDEKNIFDACKELANSEEYSFTFNEKGSWSYHDHLRPSLTGVIIVN